MKNNSPLARKLAVASFLHDPTGALRERFEACYPKIMSTFDGRVTFVLSDETLGRYPGDVAGWSGIVRSPASQQRQFRSALETTVAQFPTADYCVLIDGDRLLHFAVHYPEALRSLQERSWGDLTFCNRSDRALETHPASMRGSEHLANLIAGILIGRRVDYFSGMYVVSLRLLVEFPFARLNQPGPAGEERPVYPVFVAETFKLARRSGFEVHCEEFEALTFETEFERRSEVPEDTSVWMARDRLSVREIYSRLAMAADWSRVLIDLLDESPCGGPGSRNGSLAGRSAASQS